MENTNNALVVMADNSSMISTLTARTTVFCSISANTAEEKALLFNSMNNPEKRVGDCVNMTINAKDLFCEMVDLTSEKTGEIESCPRIVIIDDKGVGYVAVSFGIFNALKKVIAIYGAPTWDKPIPLEVKQITKGDRKILTFNVKAK